MDYDGGFRFGAPVISGQYHAIDYNLQSKVIIGTDVEGGFVNIYAPGGRETQIDQYTDGVTRQYCWDANGNYVDMQLNANNDFFVTHGNIYAYNGAISMNDMYTQTFGLSWSDGGYDTTVQFGLASGQQAIVLAGANLFMVYNANGTLYSNGIPSGFNATLTNDTFTLTRSQAFVYNFIRFKTH